MPYSKTCKLVGFAAIGISAILVLVLVYNLSPRICEKDGELMFRSTKKCYPKESQGPCPNNLIILEASERSQYGECNCPYTQFNRTMFFHNETQMCHFIFTQAYCQEGEWLTVKKIGNAYSPSCEPNTCLQHSSGNEEHSYETTQWVPIKGGGCAKLGQHAEDCPEGAVVTFYRDYILPSCKTPKIIKHKRGSIGVPAANCRSGSFPSIMGKCQPQFEFDFD